MMMPLVLIDGGGGGSLDFATTYDSGADVRKTITQFVDFNHSAFAIAMSIKVLVVPATGSGLFTLQSAGAFTTLSIDATFITSGTFGIQAQRGYSGTGIDVLSYSAGLAINIWHAVYLTSDINGLRLYINGTLVASNATPRTYSPISGIDTILIGNTIGASSAINGYINRPAFFSGTVPTAASIHSAGKLVDLTSKTGLWSYLKAPADNIGDDTKSAIDWTVDSSVMAISEAP